MHLDCITSIIFNQFFIFPDVFLSHVHYILKSTIIIISNNLLSKYKHDYLGFVLGSPLWKFIDALNFWDQLHKPHASYCMTRNTLIVKDAYRSEIMTMENNSRYYISTNSYEFHLVHIWDNHQLFFDLVVPLREK